MSPSPLWALIVTIENYATPDLHIAAEGATKDGDNVHSYLTESLEVPRSRIVRLKDKEATRSSIISSFQNHLIQNQQIQHGDALLFHYSGHGGRVKAPEGWVVGQKGDSGDDDGTVEAIIPYDEGLSDEARKDRPITCIPDRTLAALISRASQRHGDNITIVLDCCHSGHGTRGGPTTEERMVPRAIESSHLSPLHPAVDSELLPDSPSVASRRTKGRFKALAANHVLMAACGPRESAMGGLSSGGLFTTLWLRALRRTDIYPRTYAEMIKAIERDMNAFRTRFATNQHPQCDGIVRDRLVFEQEMATQNYIDGAPVESRGLDTFYVNAGEIHGIQIGTRFEICVKGAHLQSAPTVLCTVKAIQVFPIVSLLKRDPGDPSEHGILAPRNGQPGTTPTKKSKSKPRYLAVVTEPLERLRYVLRKGALSSARAQESFVLFEKRVVATIPPGDRTGIREVTDEGDPNLELSFSSDGILTLHCLDKKMENLPNMLPRLTASDIVQADFAKIFKGIARFLRLLALVPANRPAPFAEMVDFELLAFSGWDDDQGSDGGHSDDGFFVRSSSTPVAFRGDEADVVEDHEYAILLRNRTSKPLHVQIWYFDPTTFQIVVCYKSANPADATLPANGSLQIGASSDAADPLFFHRPDGMTSDTTFVKVFISDQPTSLDFLHQDNLFDVDEVDEVSVPRFSRLGPSEPREGDAEAVSKARGQWDTVLRKITVR